MYVGMPSGEFSRRASKVILNLRRFFLFLDFYSNGCFVWKLVLAVESTESNKVVDLKSIVD